MRWAWALLLAIFPLEAPASPLAQEEVRAFRLRSEKRSITVSAENRWLVPEGAGEAQRNGLYRQSLELDFSGSVYHPNFLSYALASRLGVSEWDALRGSWDGLRESLANQARLGASHRLYESLTSALGLDGSLTSASTFRQGILGPDLALQFLSFSFYRPRRQS